MVSSACFSVSPKVVSLISCSEAILPIVASCMSCASEWNAETSGIEEFGPFTDCQYLPKAARIMAKSGLTVVARDGANPIHFATPLEYEEIAVEAIAVKANTIGAGDGFDAGFLRALYAGLPLRSCIDLGSYTARQLISGAWER